MGSPALPPTPALIQTAANAKPWPGLEGFIAARIHPDSDRTLVAALRNLHNDSPSFRTVLTAFWREQQTAILYLQRTSARTSGNISLYRSRGGYILTLMVQEVPARLGLDRLEPWIGSLVFLALEVSRRGDVTETSPQQFEFSKELIREMWEEQARIRKDLRKAGGAARSGLAWDGERLFLREVLAGQGAGPNS